MIWNKICGFGVASNFAVHRAGEIHSSTLGKIHFQCPERNFCFWWLWSVQSTVAWSIWKIV